MSQTPYDDAGFGMDEVYAEPERTSIASVLGLICSIVGCCLPVGILGVVLGLFGVIGSSRSRGRVGGRGLGIVAIILGALNTAIWIGIAVAITGGVNQLVTQIAPQFVQFIEDAESDPAAARALLSPQEATNYSDAELLAFNQAVEAEFGATVTLPQSLGEMFEGWVAAAPAFQMYQGQQVIPIPATFDNGPVMVVVIQDLGGSPGSSNIPVGDIHILSADGSVIVRLSDFDDPAVGVGAIAPEAPPADEDAAPAEPAGEDEGP